MIATIIRRGTGKIVVVTSGQQAPTGTVVGVMVDGSYYGEADPAILDAVRNRPQPSVWQGIRESLGLSQTELAKAIGCSQSAVSLWESRGSEPRAEYRQKILALQ